MGQRYIFDATSTHCIDVPASQRPKRAPSRFTLLRVKRSSMGSWTTNMLIECYEILQNVEFYFHSCKCDVFHVIAYPSHYRAPPVFGSSYRR